MAVPPAPVTASLIRPTRGLAVSPEKPSEPPHLTPSTSVESGTGSRCACAAIPTSSSTRASPSSISSPAACAPRVRTLAPAAMPGSSRSSWLDSQPRPSSSTPPALGWLASAASRLRVPSRSSPSWEQPKGWAKACTPSTRPAWRVAARAAIFSAVRATQPTVGITQISLRVPTRPSATAIAEKAFGVRGRRAPAPPPGASILAPRAERGREIVGVNMRARLRCRPAPARSGSRTCAQSPPPRCARSATLWPLGIASAMRTPASSPAARSRNATATSSRGSTLNRASVIAVRLHDFRRRRALFSAARFPPRLRREREDQ